MKKNLLIMIFTIFAVVCMLGVTEEAHAAGYDFTWDGIVIYLSKKEATKAAQKLEDNIDVGNLLTGLGVWIPGGWQQKIAVSVCAITTYQYSQAAKKLRRCGRKGATITIPYPIGIGGALRVTFIKVQNR